ncbi:Unknown protein [Striga hermonthica]|uniref:Late embryogenesis abundant protein LEA-2 subgroup domain-containing protein n=1 Tax=Striga hermonthica TaxID=68872 RepID=A0A9N7R7C6_STRHE|nr:Unknown protein [Striga hermonthica]
MNNPKKAVVEDRWPQQWKFIAAVSFVCILLASLIAMAACVLLLPKDIQYSVDRARAVRLPTTNLSFTVRANNPHRLGFSFHYDRIDAKVKYADRLLVSADQVIPPFHQPRRNVTLLNLNFNLNLKNHTELTNSGYLNLTLEITTKLRLDLGLLKLIHRQQNITCGSLLVPFSGPFHRVVCVAHMSG